MILKGEKIDKGNNKYVEFSLSTQNLDVGGWCCCFGDGSVRWTLNKTINSVEYPLYESEIKKGKENNFNIVKINENRLCNKNPKQPIILRFFNGNSTSVIG